MEQNIYDLTNPQKSIWYMEEFYKGSAINNICGSLTIDEKVDFDKLEKSVNLFVKYNDSFHIKIHSEDSIPKQYFSKPQDVDLEVIDINDKKDVLNIEKEMVSIPFNVTDSPLSEFKLFKLPNGSGGFVVKAHHLISDAATFALIGSNIAKIYKELKDNESVSPDINSYVDYISSETEYLSSEKFKKDEKYWNTKFSTVPDVASIPASCSNNTIFDNSSKRETFELSQNIVNQIKNICQKEKISIFNFFMAVYALYLGRVSNLNDFVIGTPILNRSTFKEKHTSGMFINTAPLRINIDDNSSFVDFVSAISKDSLSMLRHQKYPYQYILDNLRKKFDNIPNLYDVLLSYQITKTVDKNIDLPYSVHWIEANEISCGINIHIHDNNDSGALSLSYDYLTSKYSLDDIIPMHNRILNIIDQLLKNINVSMKDIEIVTSEEKEKILNRYKENLKSYDYCNNIFDQIKENSKNNLDYIAVETSTEKITYSQLINNVNKLSNYLLDNGIKQHSNIGIITTRSIDTIISILSIINIGCTYVPLDPEYPIDRIAYMLDTSKVNCVLAADKASIPLVKNDNIKFIDVSYKSYKNYSDRFNRSFNRLKDDNLYIVFTSGSTGSPKGITLSQKNMLNLIYFEKDCKHLLNDNIRILQFATMSFDVSYQEIFSALLTSSTLVLVDEETRKDINKLSDYIYDKKIDTLFIPPAYLRILTENLSSRNKFKSYVKNIITAGEQLIITDGIRALINHGIIINNHYGPAETHVATTYIIDKSNVEDKPPIGYPISNSSVYILDQNQNLCPEYVVGEIAIAGDCVGNGYFDNSDLTGKKFTNDIFSNNKMYLTGDLGYIDRDNILHYIGRSDFQVKINGFRIELQEIDKVLMQYDDISGAISVIREFNNKKYIITYFASKVDVSSKSLFVYLRSKLPTYMIPSKLVKMDTLPLTPNGKVDKRALPDIDLSENSSEYIPPKTENELKLAGIWGSLFNTNKISTNSNFFEIGGDSLLSIKLCAMVLEFFNVNISVKDVFDSPVFSELLTLIENLGNISKVEITKAKSVDYYPLSSAQKRIYYTCSLAGDKSVLYNLPGGIILDGVPNINKLEEAFKSIIRRHEAFRTSFEVIDGDVVQKVSPQVDFKLKISSANYNDLNLCFKNFIKPFDLKTAPLFDSELIKFENGKSLLLFNMHHIISDGASLQILIKDLCALYNGITLDDVNLTYKDFAVWEVDCLENNLLDDSKKYWLSQFKNDIPILELPTTFLRPSVRSFNGAKVYRTIDENITNKIMEFAKLRKVTPYMILLAAYYILLSKYSSQNDIVIGSPVVGRDNINLTDIIGIFVNTLPLRIKANDNYSFSRLLENIKKICLNGFKHQTYPLNNLINDLNINRDSSRSPLFDVLFTFQNNGLAPLTLDEINSSYYLPDSKIAKFDLSLEVTPINNVMSINFEYSTDLFDKDFISGLANHYLNILSHILDFPEEKLMNIPFLSDEEEKTISQYYNNTQNNYPKTKTIINLFEEQVQKTPKNIAIVFDGKKISYKELNKKANRLAHYLINCGIKKKDIVAIMMRRSPEMIVSVLAVLKAGAAYVPIDTAYPDDRVSYILSNSNAHTLLVDSTISDISYDCQKIEISWSKGAFNKCSCENINYSSPNDLVYLIYTSGSTGKPKGVTIGHSSLVNYIYWARSFYLKMKPLNFPLYSSIAFDLTVTSIYTPLISGGSIVIYSDNDVLLTLKKIFNDGLSDIIKLTPAHLSLVSEFDCSEIRIKKMIVGGDILTHELCKKIHDKFGDMHIYNEYGPTEATVGCMIYEYKLSDSKYKSVPIGKPISNTQIYTLDKNLNPLPFDCPGELYISGDCLSLGYRDSSLNDGRFIKSPFEDNKLLYKTGDVAVLHRNYVLEYLGRNDAQVKLNGFRIELKEIDNVVTKYPSITESLTLVHNNEKRSYLVTYFTSGKKVNTLDLSSFLHSKLASYMVPNVFMQIDAFPINGNGKIDKKLLPKPILKSKQAYVPPTTDLEKALCSIWQNLFGLKKVGINDNFFDLGGDSLSAIKFQMEALNQNLSISYSDIFTFPTIRQLSCKTGDSVVTEKLDKEYDYSKINQLLSFNDVKNIPKKVSCHKINNILLTGATGFLGSHILDSYFSNNPRGTVYCFVRRKDSKSPAERLRQTLNFYFGNKYDKMIGKKIIVIPADIAFDNFGLSKFDYKLLSKKIDIVINSAAIVKHYGDYEKFYDINVLGTQKLIDFCMKFKKKLYHISTASISGMGLSENNENQAPSVTHFKEKDLYKKQNLNNSYIETKFEAERLILENISFGLNACIFRMGNISNRYSDAKFQINVSENAFVNRVKSILSLHVIQEGFKEHRTEFAPVDFCANAIVKIIQSNPDFTVFHIFNHNLISFIDIVQYLNDLGTKLDFVSDKDFASEVKHFLKDPNLKNDISGLATDLNADKIFSLNVNILLDCSFTVAYLDKIGFEWPKIDKNYITNYIEYFKKIKYFN